jgi:hypothetical protein
MTHILIPVWAHSGPQSGQILEMERVDADQAVADGWGQDMGVVDHRYLLAAEPAAPFPPDPPEVDPDDDDNQVVPVRRTRGRPRKDA